MKHVKSKKIGPVVVLTPQRDLFGGDETYELQTTIGELNEDGNRFLVVNLDKVRLLNSTGLSVLIEGHKLYKNRGARMALCCLKPHPENVIAVAKLSAEFKIYKTKEEAIAGFAEDIPTAEFELP